MVAALSERAALPEERSLSPHAFTVPPEQRYFEDYPEGAVFEYGSVTVDAAEIIEFARRFDPQPMHVDPEAAACGPFGGRRRAAPAGAAGAAGAPCLWRRAGAGGGCRAPTSDVSGAGVCSLIR